MEESKSKGRGRPPGGASIKRTVMLEPDTYVWAAAQEGGLSGTIRRSLRHAYNADLVGRHIEMTPDMLSETMLELPQVQVMVRYLMMLGAQDQNIVLALLESLSIKTMDTLKLKMVESVAETMRKQDVEAEDTD